MILLLRTIKSDKNIKVDFTAINQFSIYRLNDKQIRNTVFNDVQCLTLVFNT